MLKIQVLYQFFACKYKYQYQYPKNVLKYNLSTSTSTKYNKTDQQRAQDYTVVDRAAETQSC